ncbi:hypothetical protein E6H23_03160 [Candidatus Bathyarchaeota archaeon]|nr:MAG: hypothetical protein E6H23_03160 [Candidatus Bathyarchaeota archaeon]
MALGWLRDKRTRFVVKSLPTLLGPIVLFATLVSLFGYPLTILIAVIAALFLWTIANQVVENGILLNVKQGQRVKGHLAEIENQPFDWDIADENNMILLRKGERRKFKSIDGGRDDRAYTVRRKIPWPARWYLILDMYGKKIYPRHWQHSRSH